MLKYAVDPTRSFKGASLMAEGELNPMDAERDLLRSKKAAKEPKLWRSMKITVQNNEIPNALSVQAILSQI